MYTYYTLLHIYAFSETRYLRATNYSRWDLTVSGFRRPSVFHDSVKLITTVLYLKRYDNTILYDRSNAYNYNNLQRSE